MDKLRLRFSKTGRAVYISHLDLMRTLQRSFLRAGYRLKYSEGFNPHAQISIALPLSVGTGSLCELMDFRLEGEPDLGGLPERLTAKMPEGLEALEVYEAERKPAQIKWLRAEGVFEYDGRAPEAMAEGLSEFYAQDAIVITRKTKRGEGDSDIRPAVREIGFVPQDGGVRAEMLISAQEPTLNPELIADALRQKAPRLAPDFASFTRIEVYDENLRVFR
ncbi:MAG: TIGR03936 family radical SAM-associated protein [Oscillospiraceae bacterium]|nr:TIGR03936 family radical SAM-associated protein [Oscillospiraceae bacterium]HNX99338.1 TIGR03936 family radical SAM-associated protein [Oscillospiraceae bacterium]